MLEIDHEGENYQRKFKEANVEYWANQGLLTGIEDFHVWMVTALMLQNQSLMNNVTDNLVKNSLEIISKVIPKLLAHKIVSVQPMLGPVDRVFYNRYRYGQSNQEGVVSSPPYNYSDVSDFNLPDVKLVVENEEIAAKIRIFKSKWSDEDSVDDIVEKLVQEINVEILTDIYNNAGTVTTLENINIENLNAHLTLIDNTIHRKSLLNFKKWIAVGEKCYQQHENYIKSVIDNGLYEVHIVKGWDKSCILMGMKGERYFDSSYDWCPYIMLTQTASILSEELLPRKQFMIRYGKKLLREGSKHFGKIILNEPDKT